MRPLALGLRAPYRLKRTIALLAQATLNLDFTRGGPIDSRVTFSRASGGTSFRPVALGTLVNQLLWASDFTNAAWTKAGATVVTGQADPFGGTSASKLVDSATNSAHYFLQSVVSGTGTATSAWIVKPAGRTKIQVRSESPQTGMLATMFNLTTGAIQNGTGSIVALDNGFFLCVATAPSNGTGANGYHLMQTLNDSWQEAYTGDGTSGVIVYRAALFTGTVTAQQVLDNGGIPLTFDAASNLLRLDRPGDPIELFTAPANVPRFDYDPVSRQCRGLLVEEQRTNLVTHSREFDNAAWSKNAATVVPNAAVAPDGTLTADKIIATSANTQHYVFGGGASIAANSTGTLSIYAKAAEQSSIAFSASGSGAFTAIFDLAAGSVSYQAGGTAGMSPVGNGWYRCWFTCTTTAFAFVPYLFPNTSNSYAGDGVSGVFVWGGQHESGAFHTSYIPTSGAAATRAADAAVVATLAPWYNATEGTLFAEFTHTDISAVDRVAVSLHSTSWVNNALHVRTFNSAVVVSGYNGATADVNISPGISANLTSPNKVAVGIAANNWASSFNGRVPVIDNAGAVPPVNVLAIGCSSSGGGNSRNGHIRRVAFWPRRMSNLDLQRLTR